MLTLSERIRGGIYGALVGDALGVPVEFTAREQRDIDPVGSMRGFGTWEQPPGTWSDDGSLLLCSTEALLDGYEPDRMANAFVRWIADGHWSARGTVFDVGSGTRTAIRRLACGTKPEHAGGTQESDNGNGSLMRILPVALRFASQPLEFVANVAAQSSRLTHGHPRSCFACAIYCTIACRLAAGTSPQDAIRQAATFVRRWNSPCTSELSRFERALDPNLGSCNRREIESGGYVVETLEAALWCVLNNSSYEETVLDAVNLGADTDTTACVTGGLAGVIYGEQAIPVEWRSQLPREDELDQLISRFVQQSTI